MLAPALTPAIAPSVEIDGFVKNFFVVQQIPQYQTQPGGPQAPDAATLVANNLRTRMNVVADPTGWMTAALSYNFVPRVQDDDFATLNEFINTGIRTTYRAADLDAFLYPGDPGSDDNFVILQNLDRAYVAFAAPRFDFLLGRQAVAFGVARSVNPTDVVAPFLFTEIDTEDRIGVDAARLRIPTGALGEIDVGYIAGDSFKESESAWYARVRMYVANTDIVLTAMRFRLAGLAGIDVTRAIGGAGFWLEAALVRNHDGVRADSPVAGTKYDDKYYGRLSTGMDYSLGGGSYLFAEYHFNGPGSNDTSDYRFLYGTPAYTDGAVYLLGKHYVIPGISWPATPLLSVTVSVLWNLSDGSALLAPVVEYNWRENVYLSAGAFAGLGAAPTYDPVPGSTPVIGPGLLLDPLSTEFASEFGAYPDTSYASIRYYY